LPWLWFYIYSLLATPRLFVRSGCTHKLAFQANGDDYRLILDPFSLNGGVNNRPENLDRVYIKGSLGANLFEQQVRDTVLNVLRAIRIPPDSASGVPFETFIETAITSTASNTPASGTPPLVYREYEAVLLPDREGTNIPSTIWSRGRGTEVTEGTPVRLIFLE
jgi:hypothetical protein